jgi:hypothetical protein
MVYLLRLTLMILLNTFKYNCLTVQLLNTTVCTVITKQASSPMQHQASTFALLNKVSIRNNRNHFRTLKYVY